MYTLVFDILLMYNILGSLLMLLHTIDRDYCSICLFLPQAVLKRRITRTQPSLQHLQTRDRMFFPGWYTQTPPQPKEPPQRRREQLPVQLPPLPARAKVSDKASLKNLQTYCEVLFFILNYKSKINRVKSQAK